MSAKRRVLVSTVTWASYLALSLVIVLLATRSYGQAVEVELDHGHWWRCNPVDGAVEYDWHVQGESGSYSLTTELCQAYLVSGFGLTTVTVTPLLADGSEGEPKSTTMRERLPTDCNLDGGVGIPDLACLPDAKAQWREDFGQ